MCNCRSWATEIKNLSSAEKFVICSHPCRIITHKYQQTHWLHRLVCFLLAWKLLNGKRQPGKFAYNYSQHYTCNSLNSFHHWYSCCYASLHPFSQGPCTGLTRTCSASELCACACPVTCACPCSSRGPCTHRRQAHQGCMVPVGWKLRTRVFGTSTILKLLVMEAVWCTAAVVTVLVDTCEKCVSFWECWCTLKAFRLRVARVIGGPADLPYSGKLNKLNLFSLLNKITISPLLKYL